ncbi:MAG: hypothetical protein A3G02_00330 [Candidatus Yanofskybacteria bacterium RIFCSPLOWO2_12_FULL_44_13b]|uniref:Uncharacterized protein n=2 Tax=Candidatus Yanofskyibacteriota TaxID=1752733 RepID=A0A1F8H0W9_9BACT|nr:MAG: hypothetical protein UW14_C0013G0027 [Candidatus Yanofskybacteria bacterium GW2011_GWA2_44_10]KKT90397.1 MAG: hypothetical protein UW90_C0002G0046 [Candidatus Yanofskybacteria bacterium GW2011_GWB1_45_11]OGN02980.1 MAG: hypothetical protein A2657_01175 [Candidatus Yanofskybacteria bacterium RIFCSPHIGHO2_01_FULL_44_110b]OGN15192.1 MAG: hypothetical protein A3C01_02000 [Candidatus Yanofskybacteria bacterium RIFCSPHIGHO2_02_FULL_44_36b]OGN18470.1 MAG: hypothetical protein A3F50_01590 [Cand
MFFESEGSGKFQTLSEESDYRYTRNQLMLCKSASNAGVFPMLEVLLLIEWVQFLCQCPDELDYGA